MKLNDLNHICVIVKSLEASSKFYIDFLGLIPHKEVDGWFYVDGTGPVIHLIEIEEAEIPSDEDMHHYYRHFAFEVDSLREVVEKSLEHGFLTFQMDSEGNEKKLINATDPIDFGIKTIFVRDPDHNLWEFVQKNFSWNLLWT